MAVEQYPVTKENAPKLDRSEERKAIENDVREFLKDGGVVDTSPPKLCKTVAEVIADNEIKKANLNGTISHKYGSIKLKS